MAALRILQSREATWPAARDLLLRVTGNVVAQPHIEKFRSIKKTPGGKFADAVYSQPGGRELMAAIGFVEQGAGTLALPPGAALERCRLAHAHIERSTTLTGGGDDGGGSHGGKWNNHTCSGCRRSINSGEAFIH